MINRGLPGAVVFREGVCGSLMHNWNPLLVKDGLCQSLVLMLPFFSVTLPSPSWRLGTEIGA